VEKARDIASTADIASSSATGTLEDGAFAASTLSAADVIALERRVSAMEVFLGSAANTLEMEGKNPC
jgi:hypothetical protein